MIPQGSAKKVTIYLNEDTRSHVDALWNAILQFLRHKHIAGATILRGDSGFGSHEVFENVHAEYIGQHRPVRIEFIDTAERIDEVLPAVYDMVTDGLVTVQDLTVVKSVSKDHKQHNQELSLPRKLTVRPAKLVRIYLEESDKLNDEPLYEAIVKKMRMMGFSGATVYRGILGYGVKGHTHREGRFHFSHDLPIMISTIEKAERANELIQVVSSMMQHGLIVTSDVELHEFTHQIPSTSGDPHK